MVVDDAYYITPHEAALAAVATSMKKARLQFNTLVVNAILGGILFSSGSILCVAIHSENPGIEENNPGILNMMSGIAFGIGLFYVVIMGADLFNSNILFFSVGVLRRAVSVFDLLVSWTVCLFANLGGSLLVSYVFCHLSGVSSQPLWKTGSRALVEGKANFSFIETMLKAIVGNFLVCLAIYLQLLAKPIHVKFMVLVAPIFTFVACGFTHTVADMTLSFIGMLNGADVSVGKYIWKLLIPAVIGNIIGGFSFSLVVPFYLHLVVVERDRKRLSLPEYEARDEQPELNFDSRVVRITPHENRAEEEDAEEAEESEGDNLDGLSEKRATDDSFSNQDDENIDHANFQGSYASLPEESAPRAYTASDVPSNLLTRFSTLKSNYSGHSLISTRSRKRPILRSPPGVFPVRGMGEPLAREKTIENPYSVSARSSIDGFDSVEAKKIQIPRSLPIKRSQTEVPPASRAVNDRSDEVHEAGSYSAIDDRPGAKLERAITRLVERKPRERKSTAELPRTTQDTFPFNRPAANSRTYSERPSSRSSSLFRTMSPQFIPRRHSENINDFNKELKQAGVSQKAAASSNSVAGIANYSPMDFPTPITAPLRKHNSHSTP